MTVRHASTAPRSALLVALLCMPATAPALPTGPAPGAGQTEVAITGPGQMRITQGTPRAVLNWNGFSIARGERLDIRQPDAQSVLLNRVAGPGASVIDGSLFANGRVFLLNPDGILFGSNAQVQVGGLLASTLRLDDADFLAGRYRFSAGNPGARAENRGSLTAGERGFVFLLGERVANDGSIGARMGTVALAAGEQVTLDFQGDGLSSLRIDKAAFDAAVANRGMLAADGGQVLLSAHAAQALSDAVLTQTGVVRARSLTERNGRILLDGGANGVTLLGGTLDVSAAQSGLRGGRADVLGWHVGLLDGAAIDASGEAGGGAVHVGGGRGGADPALPNADAVYAAPDVRIRADATNAGNGGSVIVWADQAMRYHGAISATGGARGGDGGFIETSGAYLDTAGIRIDASAARGKAGEWLLDPYDVEIVRGMGQAGMSGGPDAVTFGSAFGGASSPAVIGAQFISSLLSNGTSVSIRTGRRGPASGNGDIAIFDRIVKTGDADASLSLHAYRNIYFLFDGNSGQFDPDAQYGPAILASGAGRLHIDLDSNTENVGNGAISLSRAQIASNGGNIRFYGGNNPANGAASGIRLSDSSIDATSTNGGAGGSITMRSVGGTYYDYEDMFFGRLIGFEVTGNTSLRAGQGGIRLFGSRHPPIPATGQIAPMAVRAQAFVPEDTALTINDASLESTGPVSITGLSEIGTGLTMFNASIVAGGALDVTGRSAQTMGQFVPGLTISASTLRLAGKGRLTISGESAMSDVPGFMLTDYTEIDGGAGDIVLRAMNAPDSDGLRHTMMWMDADVRLRGTGSLAMLPGGVSNAGTLTQARNVDINVYADDMPMPAGPPRPSGLTLNPDLLTTNIESGFADVVIGGAGHAGKITVHNGGFLDGRYNLTLQNGAADSAGIELLDGLSNPGRQLTLSSGGAVTQGQGAGLDVAALLLHGAGPRARFDLSNPANAVPRFAARFDKPRDASDARYGDVSLRTRSSLSVQPLSGAVHSDSDNSGGRITATQSVVAHDLALRAGGDIELAQGISTLGSDITLVSGGRFINSAGAAIAPGGTGVWNIFADTWEGEARGGLAGTRPLPNIYNCAYGDACASQLPAGNHFIYARQPTVQISADSASLARVYGDAAQPISHIASGLINGDLMGEAVTGAYASAVDASTPAGSYPVTTSFASPAEYKVDAQGATVTVAPAMLTYVADPARRIAGAPNPALTGTVTGFVRNDTLDSATSGLMQFASPAHALSPPGLYAVDGSGLSALNYIFSQAPGNATALRVDAAPVPPAPAPEPPSPLPDAGKAPLPWAPVVPPPGMPIGPIAQAQADGFAPAFLSWAADAGVPGSLLARGPQVACGDVERPAFLVNTAGDGLGREWERVKNRTRLNACVAVSRKFECSGF